MKPTKPAKKPNTGAPGVKLLITAASLAATLGGWALISSDETKPALPPAPAPNQVAVPAVTIKLAPLPTLVPMIASPSQNVTINRPRPAAAVAAAPQPAAAPSTLVLRDVSAPQVHAGGSAAPAPVANTRSSR